MEAYIQGLGTVQPCIDCKCLIAGGPTRCIRCADKHWKRVYGLVDIPRHIIIRTPLNRITFLKHIAAEMWIKNVYRKEQKRELID